VGLADRYMTVDTNLIIDFLNGDATAITELTRFRKAEQPLLLSTIVEAEVLSFSGMSKKEREITERFLEENFISIPFDRTIARIASNLRASKKIKLPDAAIAATALYSNTSLITRNVKDFKNIPGLNLITF
jgi:predicted nucleic acid-binding protein